jgi:hypothetical protein
MQILPVYLYQNNLNVILDLDPTVRGVNQVMYQHDLKIQKGLKNKVRIQFKNSDQKRISISNTQTFVFSMYDAINRRLLIEKELTVIDAGTTSTKGIAELTLSESDTVDLDKSSYTYSVKYIDPSDGTYLPVYSNTYYGINGTVHLYEDIYPVLQPSQEVSDLQMSFNVGTDLYEYKSRAIYASPEYNGNTALHTVAFYLTNFKGSVHIQATLSNDPDDLSKYSTIKTSVYTGYTGIDSVNFNGVYSYINVLVIPEKGPLDLNNRDNQAYRGTFDKFLYRS